MLRIIYIIKINPSLLFKCFWRSHHFTWYLLQLFSKRLLFSLCCLPLPSFKHINKDLLSEYTWHPSFLYICRMPVRWWPFCSLTEPEQISSGVDTHLSLWLFPVAMTWYRLPLLSALLVKKICVAYIMHTKTSLFSVLRQWMSS